MNFSSSMRARGVAAFAVAIALTACSLLVNKDKDQCSTNADCQPAGAAVCISGVCVASSSLEGGSDAMSDGPIGDEAGDGGCSPKVPVSQSDFLNEKCTNAQCIDFDNCARLGLCPGVDGGDGGLPALITPPVGGI